MSDNFMMLQKLFVATQLQTKVHPRLQSRHYILFKNTSSTCFGACECLFMPVAETDNLVTHHVWIIEALMSCFHHINILEGRMFHLHLFCN